MINFDEYFKPVASLIDTQAIYEEWISLKPQYNIDQRFLPLPIWAKRGFTESRENAWAILQEDLTIIPESKPFCIYVHIPFCAVKCGFCDCYSFRLSNHKERNIELYVDTLLREIEIWGNQANLPKRPVSTIHFGGGTPTFLRVEQFTRLVKALNDTFNISPQTEWAIESTSSDLDDEMVVYLTESGFSRLHVGIQSLDDQVRQLINRREKSSIVLEKINRFSNLGWIISVDMILGLPQQTIYSVLKDIQLLNDAGIDGYSLYELQISSRNHKFAMDHNLINQSKILSYFMMQAASSYLSTNHFNKTMFNHFAKPRDTDLYFTFPERDEDCLALGTIANGVFGTYHYRHPEYSPYCHSIQTDFPGIQGGTRLTSLETSCKPLEIALISSKIPLNLLQKALGNRITNRLVQDWTNSRLVIIDEINQQATLTGNGSWFTGTMLEQIYQMSNN